jgi:hypothetical protein
MSHEKWSARRKNKLKSTNTKKYLSCALAIAVFLRFRTKRIFLFQFFHFDYFLVEKEFGRKCFRWFGGGGGIIMFQKGGGGNY